jgi:hypothetical protein
VPPKTEEVLKNIDLSSAKLHKTDDITKNFKLIKIQRPGSSKEEVLVKEVNLPPAKGYYITEQTTYAKKPKFEMPYYTPPQFERVPIIEYVKKAREKKLPVRAPAERNLPILKPRNLPILKPRNLPILKPKETPYKETVAREGFKTAEMLENLLKGGQSKVVETKETVLKPIENLKKLSKEIPEEAKNDPEIRRRFIEIIKDVKKISGRARFENVSDDLRALDAKVNELNDLLKKYSNKGRKKQTKKGLPMGLC